jgi:hypothetical protein
LAVEHLLHHIEGIHELAEFDEPAIAEAQKSAMWKRRVRPLDRCVNATPDMTAA